MRLEWGCTASDLRALGSGFEYCEGLKGQVCRTKP